MTVPARPKEFLQPFMGVLHWLAVHYPDATKNWDKFCDELILRDDVESITSGSAPRWHDGDPMLPAKVVFGVFKRKYKVDMLRHYSRQQLRYLARLKNCSLFLIERYGLNYNPFAELLYPHAMVLNNVPPASTTTTPESIIPPTIPSALPSIQSSITNMGKLINMLS